ncbi:MAG: hypothetical protein ACK53L_35020, partial [Pirellulaceae bacterium]
EHFIEVQAGGYGIDRWQPQIIYVNESARFSLLDQSVRWSWRGADQALPLEFDKTYIAPSGYRLHVEKHPARPPGGLLERRGMERFVTSRARLAGAARARSANRSRIIC